MQYLTLALAFLSCALVQAAPAPIPASNSNSSAIEEVNEALRLESRQRPRATVFSKCTVSGRVALTFDDGPYWNTEKVARTLSDNGAKGTFFVNGNNWACIYNTEISRQLKFAYDRGHQIASHTWAHKNLATLNWDSIHHQMWLTEQAIMRITGANPAFMRPPYGSYNNLVLEAAYIRGQSVVLWDLDTGDSAGVSASGQQARINEFASRNPRPANGLILAHETYDSSVNTVLPYAIQRLKAAGFQLVTVAECLGRAPYQSVGQPGVRDASWKC